MRLSLDRLAIFHPYLASGDPSVDPKDTAFFADVGRDYGLQALREHLHCGDCRAAVVAGVSPHMLIVAAYSDDFDATVFLVAGPQMTASLGKRHRIERGTRLITCNRYLSNEVEPTIQADIHVGPRASGCPWTGVWPVIADFLTDDEARLAELHAGISEDEWNRATELAFAEYEGGMHVRLMEAFRW